MIALYDVDPRVAELATSALGKNPINLADPPSLAAYLRSRVSDPFSVLFISHMALASDSDLVVTLQRALEQPSFHCFILSTGSIDTLPTALRRNGRAHFVVVSTDTTQLSHHLLELQRELELAHLVSLFQKSIHSPKLDDGDETLLTCAEALRLYSGASAVHLLRYCAFSKDLGTRVSSGGDKLESVDGSELLSRIARSPQSLLSLTASEARTQLGVTVRAHAVVFLEIVPYERYGALAFVFDQSVPDNAALQRCLLSSRCLAALYQGIDERIEVDGLRLLVSAEGTGFSKRGVLWEFLRGLKILFNSDGASIYDVIQQDGDQISFDKTYVHHGRAEHYPFSVSYGRAHQCIHTRNILLVRKMSTTDDKWEALELALGDVSVASSKRLELASYRAPQAVEIEKCEVYVPLLDPSNSNPIGCLKVSSFERVDAFGLVDVFRIQALAPACSLMLRRLKRLEVAAADLERKALHDRMLEQAEGLFFYREIALGIFHQVGNHLSTVRGHLQLVESFAEKARDRKDELLSETRDASELASAAEDLIDRAQRMGKTLRPVPSRCKLFKDILRPAIQYAERSVQGTGVQVFHSLGSDDYDVNLDKYLVKEALINLLNNSIWAVKANRYGGKREIFVAARPFGRVVRIEIEDSGVGIDPSDFPNLFKPFFTRRPGGTGLGLYFTKRLLEQSGGSVQMARTIVEKGTKMAVMLPLESGR